MTETSTTNDTDALARLAARVEQLEARVAALEKAPAPATSPSATRNRTISGSSGAGAGGTLAGLAPGWTVPYELATLERADSWIEIHEHSARPHLHRMIREVVETEGPITEALVLRRIREVWGLRRAGARVKDTFDQALRQLSYGGKLDRSADGVITLDGNDVAAVRVPTADEATKRAVDEIPPGELELALLLTARDAGALDADDLTMQVAKTFGWTRRGAEIQATLDARLEALVARGSLTRAGTNIKHASE
ncbi:MAG: DUF3320 domain-containing protein [Thermoleophilia bacterium]|nr:DUF3320 domain-containing protein [Thermoleophilia bacterium]